MMGVTQTGLLERLQRQSEVVTLPTQLGPSHLVSWLKQAGDLVERFDAIAVVEQDQVATIITATYSGRLRSLAVRTGELVQPGQSLCQIEVAAALGQDRASPVHRGRSKVAARPQSEAVALGEADPPQKQVDSDTERRPAILPAVEQLVRERAAQRATTTAKPARKKPRTKAKVYRVTPDQVGRIKGLTQRVRAHDAAPIGPPISESELVRAGLELLTSLSLEAVLAIVDENREREQAAKYGAGWPRPGRHRPRKKRSS